MAFPSSPRLDAFKAGTIVGRPGWDIIDAGDAEISGGALIANSVMMFRERPGTVDCEAWVEDACWHDGASAETQVFVRAGGDIEGFAPEGYAVVLGGWNGDYGVALRRYDAEGLQSLDSASVSPVVGQPNGIGIEAVGTTLRAFFRPGPGGEWMQVAEATDSTYPDAGRYGLWLVEASTVLYGFGATESHPEFWGAAV